MDGLGFLTLATLFTSYPLLDAPGERDIRPGVEVFRPIHADRQLDLTNLTLQLARKRLFDDTLQLHAGLALSRASGRIEQLAATPDGGLQTLRLDSPAWGAGVDVGARWHVAARGAWQLSLDVDAALMAYDRPFPAGGMRYNGMFRLGPSLSHGSFSAGLRWLHLSNGHGLTPRNPSYEGVGLALQMALPF